MNRPVNPPQVTLRDALWATAKADPVVKVTAVVFAVTVLVLILPVLAPAHRELVSLRLSPVYSLVLVVVALRWRRARIASGDEQRFWGDLNVAFSCWLAVAAIKLFYPVTGRPFLVEFAGDFIYAVYYVAFVLAVERQPHRRHRWRPIALERTLTWPAVTTFVAGLFIYFVLIPVSVSRGIYATSIPARYLYLALDAYIAIRLLYLCRAARSRRWRVLYFLLALAAGGIFAGDLFDYLTYSLTVRLGWGLAPDTLWIFTFTFLVLAARLRHYPFPAEPEPEPTKIRLEDNLPGPFGQTMIFALAFPLIHFTFSYCTPESFSDIEESNKPYREALVFVWVLLLGAIAVVQHRILERITRELRKDRARIERALRNSERELRLMIERQRTQATVRASEEKFTKAFRSSPDIMAINRLKDGRFVEVNRGYQRFLGYRPDDIQGLTTNELHVWTNPDYAKIVEMLREQGTVRDLEIGFQTQSGEKRMGLFSARLIEMDGEPCMLSIMCDISDRKREEEKIRERAALLDDAQSAIRVVDRDDRIIYWNRGAERLYGWSAEEVIGRSAEELLSGEKVNPASHGTLVCDAKGDPKSKLVISTSIPPGRKPETQPDRD